MSMSRLRKVAVLLTAVLAAVLSSGSRASADVVFDPLTTPVGGHGARSTNNGVTVSSTQNSVALLSGALIGDRTVSVTPITGAVNTLLGTTITAAAIPGKVTFSNDTGVVGNGSVLYNFSGPVNFTGVNNVILQQALADITGGKASIDLLSSSGTGTTAFQNVPTSIGDLTFNISGIASNILSSVTGLRINLNTQSSGVPDVDFAFGPVSFTNPPQLLPPLPEPATLATFGLIGLVSGVVARRKLKAQVAQA